MLPPIRVAITGAAGNIGYSLLWRIADGSCFGPDQPVILHLLEVPGALERLEGVVMEVVDSAMPLVQGIVATDNARTAFDGVNQAFLVGSRPRGPGMNRSDLVAANGPIFVGQGQALNEVAASDVRVIVVGNPCNTNCLIAQRNARDIPPERFTAMMRLDHNRAAGQLAQRAGVPVSQVSGVAIWGNHADTMYPDVTRATVGGVAATERFEQEWLRGAFLDTVATRGAAIIKARGASSAASAASAAVDHMHDWWFGTNGGVVSMALPSRGQYGVPEGLVFSFPCRVGSGGAVEVIEGWPVDAFCQSKIDQNVAALLAEREAVADLV